MMEIKARYSYLLTDTATTANVQALAAGYALANTSTRCSLMRDTSNCEACTVRNCDFRSRYEAFRAGYGCREAEERQNNDYQTCNTPII